MRSFRTRQLTSRPNNVVRNEAGEHLAGPNGHFLERYEDAYLAECRAFLEAIEVGREFPVSAVDGLRALVLAAAADRSAHAGQPVPIKGIEVTSRKNLAQEGTHHAVELLWPL